MAANSLVGNPPRRTKPTSHAAKPPPARLAKHAAKATPVGRVAEGGAKLVAKGQEKHAQASAERTQQKARVKANVQRESARIQASREIITKPRIRMLAVEYIAAIFMAVIALFFADGSYHDKMGKFFMQLTGLSALFFVLALTGTSIKAGRAAIMFGALVDVAILLNVTRKVVPNLGKGGVPNPIASGDLDQYASSGDQGAGR